MSYWSTIILSLTPADCALYERNDTPSGLPPLVLPLNLYLWEQYRQELARVHRQSTIFVAETLNHFRVHAFLSLMQMAPWDYPDEVELFVKGESHAHFTVYRIEQPSLEDLRRQKMARENRISPQDLQPPV